MTKDLSDLEWEKDFWNNCCNTFDEEQKHYVYARFMEIPEHFYRLDAKDASVIDIGGGPASMLLQSINLKKGLVVDPIHYPEWTELRYKSINIDVAHVRGEDLDESGWDEAWIYNCLQHTDDPEQIIKNALKAAKVLRIFEWIDIPPEIHEGHKMLTKVDLDRWIGKPGSGTVTLAESGCFGKAYYGVFK